MPLSCLLTLKKTHCFGKKKYIHRILWKVGKSVIQPKNSHAGNTAIQLKNLTTGHLLVIMRGKVDSLIIPSDLGRLKTMQFSWTILRKVGNSAFRPQKFFC